MAVSSAPAQALGRILAVTCACALLVAGCGSSSSSAPTDLGHIEILQRDHDHSSPSATEAARGAEHH